MYGIVTYIWLIFMVNVGVYIYIPYMGPMGNDELSTSCGMIFHGYVKNAAFKGVELKIPTDPWIGSFFGGEPGHT